MEDKIIGIYMIRCKINGKCYVGQSTNIKSRWRSHKYNLKHNKHSSKEMNKDWNAYGEDNFEFKIIQRCTKDELEELEKKYTIEFKAYDGGYNQIIGSYREGYVYTEEQKKKVGESVSGEKNGFYGKQHTEETKNKISKKKKGIKLSEEHKKRISEGIKGENNPFYGKSWKDYDYAPRSIGIIIILPSGLILEYDSLIDAEKELGVDRHTLSKLMKTGESYKTHYKKYKYREGLRVMGTENT